MSLIGVPRSFREAHEAGMAPGTQLRQGEETLKADDSLKRPWAEADGCDETRVGGERIAGAGAPAAGFIVAFGDFTALPIAASIGGAVMFGAVRISRRVQTEPRFGTSRR